MTQQTREPTNDYQRVTSATELLRRYAAGERDFHGAYLGGADLGDASLGGANLGGAYLRGAYLRGTYLRGTYLGGASLGGANLSGAYLGDASLGGADLRDASLGGAYLRGASLGGANLSGAYLGGAYLRDADLRGASLGDADLRGADLGGANLGGANLGGANLGGADLRGASLPDSPALAPIRADIERVCASAPREVAGLLAALEAGRVDGTVYEGKCACLVGTVARLRGCAYDTMRELPPDSSSLAERWALGIAAGDTPATNPVARLTADWLRAWLAAHPAQTAPVGAATPATPDERSGDDGTDA